MAEDELKIDLDQQVKSQTEATDDEIVDAMRSYLAFSDDKHGELPYKPNSKWSKFKYYWKTIVVTNPRLFSLYLLYKSIWPRLLVIVDMFTDATVCIQLYNKQETLLFSLSLLFLSFPFVMVWITSLRFIQKYINSTNKNNNNKKKHTKYINAFLIFYLFPIFGCTIVTFYEVLWVFYDVYFGLKSFVQGKILLIDKDTQISSIKQFRRIIECIGESIPQIVIQVYISININTIKVDSFDLGVSLVVSLINLMYNGYKIQTEAKFHCMSVAMYTLSVLQLGEIPIIKLVPRLPGIRNGIINYVNFSDFKIDKESLGPIFEALSDPLCKLENIKLSIASLKLLDFESCNMLASFLNKKNINVIISQTMNNETILDMFHILDKDKNGYIDENEFAIGFESFRHEYRCSKLEFTSKNQNKNNTTTNSTSENELRNKIFQRMAIRRLKKRDRIYFGDFWDAFTSVKSISYDFTQINYPIHFIFDFIIDSLENYVNNSHNTGHKEVDAVMLPFATKSDDLHTNSLIDYPANENEWNIVLNDNLKKLYHFATGLDLEKQVLPGNNQNILVSIILCKFHLNQIKYSLNTQNTKGELLTVISMCDMFIGKHFKDLLETMSNVKDMMTKKTGHHQENPQKHDGMDVFDVCLETKNYEYFSILFDHFIRHIQFNTDRSDQIEYILSKIVLKNDNNLNILVLILKQAISHALIDAVHTLLECLYTSDNNNIAANDIDSITNELINTCIYNSLEYNIDSANENTNLKITDIDNERESKDNENDKSSSVGMLGDILNHYQTNTRKKYQTDYTILKNICECIESNTAPTTTKLDKPVAFLMKQQNYELTGYKTCDIIDNNVSKYTKFLIHSIVPSILSATECDVRSILFDWANREELCNMELLEVICKHCDQTKLLQNVLSQSKFWDKLIENQQYEIYVFLVENYLNSIVDPSNTVVDSISNFFIEHGNAFLFTKQQCVLDFIEILCTNTLFIQEYFNKYEMSNLKSFFRERLNDLDKLSKSDKRKNPHLSEQLWDRESLNMLIKGLSPHNDATEAYQLTSNNDGKSRVTVKSIFDAAKVAIINFNKNNDDTVTIDVMKKSNGTNKSDHDDNDTESNTCGACNLCQCSSSCVSCAIDWKCCGNKTLDSSIHSYMKNAQAEYDTIKLLLLGTGSSGKSTVRKAITSITSMQNDNGEEKLEPCNNDLRPNIRELMASSLVLLVHRAQARQAVRGNVHAKINYSDHFSVLSTFLCTPGVEQEHLQKCIEIVVDCFQGYFYFIDEDLDNQETGEQFYSWSKNDAKIDHKKKYQWTEIVDALKTIWSLPAVQEILTKEAGFAIEDNLEYFFDRIDIIMSDNYQVNQLDAMKTRTRTVGMLDYSFMYENVKLRILDVGGQRTERRKWIANFDNVGGILYNVALDGYCTVLYEDYDVITMLESVKVFEEWCTIDELAETTIVLLFTKDDLFRNRLKHIPLTHCFAQTKWPYENEWYTGPNYVFDSNLSDEKNNEHFDECYKSGVEFIIQVFKDHFQQQEPKKQLYSFVIDATDIDSVRSPFDQIKKLMIDRHFRRQSSLV